MTTYKEYILLAHTPKEGVELGEFLHPTEWHIYGEDLLPLMMKKKAYYETVFHFVFVRECSDIINVEKLTSLSTTVTC